MARVSSTRFVCAKCGYTGMRAPGNRCPFCGRGSGWRSFFRTGSAMAAAACIAVLGGFFYLYFFQPRAAAEIVGVAHPLPRRFHIGLDVSASVNAGALEKIKDELSTCLSRFVGDESVHYQVSTFGNPGCGRKSIATLLSMASPARKADFHTDVLRRIAAIKATAIAPRDITPLTTPFYSFLDTTLSPAYASRIVIFSDLMNDDGDCSEQHLFPEAAIERFGKDPQNDLIFFYTRPRKSSDPDLDRRLAAEQDAFIRRMNTLANAGKVRVFFRRIPEDPVTALTFIREELPEALPSTITSALKGRLSRLLDAVAMALSGETGKNG